MTGDPSPQDAPPTGLPPDVEEILAGLKGWIKCANCDLPLELSTAAFPRQPVPGALKIGAYCPKCGEMYAIGPTPLADLREIASETPDDPPAGAESLVVVCEEGPLPRTSLRKPVPTEEAKARHGEEWRLILGQQRVRLLDDTGREVVSFARHLAERAIRVPFTQWDADGVVNLGVADNEGGYFWFRPDKAVICQVRRYLDENIVLQGPEAVERFRQEAWWGLVGGSLALVGGVSAFLIVAFVLFYTGAAVVILLTGCLAGAIACFAKGIRALVRFRRLQALLDDAQSATESEQRPTTKHEAATTRPTQVVEEAASEVTRPTRGAVEKASVKLSTTQRAFLVLGGSLLLGALLYPPMDRHRGTPACAEPTRWGLSEEAPVPVGFMGLLAARPLPGQQPASPQVGCHGDHRRSPSLLAVCGRHRANDPRSANPVRGARTRRRALETARPLPG